MFAGQRIGRTEEIRRYGKGKEKEKKRRNGKGVET
jgi:hypothetical protein